MSWDKALGRTAEEQPSSAGPPPSEPAPRPVRLADAFVTAEEIVPFELPPVADHMRPLGWDGALGRTDTDVSAPLAEPAPVFRQWRFFGEYLVEFQYWRELRRRDRLESNKRFDIQGLRAVAVLAVVVNHLTGHPQGGFVGVDVFFVISGYLITSLLLREGNIRGTISLIGFYKRRIRRLFPAALTVTVATLVAAHFIFLASRAREIRTDGIWATLFGANWRQIQIGSDYFKAYGPVSPLQHYWSLSVEEQFYFVWPLVLLVVYTICRRMLAHRRNATITTGAIGALALTVPSLIFAWRETSAAPVVAYFSTFSRAWELGLGATLAVLAPFVRGNRWLLSGLSWLGLALIGVSLFTVTGGHIPFPGVVLPCIGSALCLAAWTQHTQPANFLLTNGLSSYLGDISYSIYLVHFPVIVFAEALVPNRSAVFYVCVFALVIGLSALLYHGIEDPIRESNWLLPTGSELRPRPKYWGYGQLAGATLSVVALTMYALLVGPPSSKNPYAAIVLAGQLSTPGPTSPSGGTDLGPDPVTGLQNELRQALLAGSWPQIRPSFDEADAPNNHACPQTLKTAAECTWGSVEAHHTMYLVGDSTSASYFSGFAKLLASEPDWRMRLASGSGCPFTDSPIEDDGVRAADCTQRNAEVVREIQSVRPDLVVVTNSVGAPTVTGPTNAEVRLLQGYAKQIVILPARPHTRDVLQCYTQLSHPKDCVDGVPAEYAGWLANEQRVATDVGGLFIDPTLWYCADGYCPVFASTLPITRDGIHITTSYSDHLAPVILQAFRQAGALPST